MYNNENLEDDLPLVSIYPDEEENNEEIKTTSLEEDLPFVDVTKENPFFIKKEQVQEKKDEVIKTEEEILSEITKAKEDTRAVVFKPGDEGYKGVFEDDLGNKTFSIVERYGEDYVTKDYITNPAIGRDEEIRSLILVLLTNEKSAILTGKPGIGKTAAIEGLAYRIQRGDVPDALKGYHVINVKTPSLLGEMPNGESRVQALIDELREMDKVILFIDEIHMLIGARDESAMDFANIFKEGLGRGSLKVVGATTTEEYEQYVLRDKAFVRRFQRIDMDEPSREHTIQILMGTLPKIEKQTDSKLKYSHYIQTLIMAFIVDLTTEYRRVFEIGSRYPDIALTLLKQAFSYTKFDNRTEVDIWDIKQAIRDTKNVYPDVIKKELIRFNEVFKSTIEEEMAEGNTKNMF